MGDPVTDCRTKGPISVTAINYRTGGLMPASAPGIGRMWVNFNVSLRTGDRLEDKRRSTARGRILARGQIMPDPSPMLSMHVTEARREIFRSAVMQVSVIVARLTSRGLQAGRRPCGPAAGVVVDVAVDGGVRWTVKG
jgi:hypothetical protein